MELAFSWQNVVDGAGIPLAIMGMSIVFISLLIITIVTSLMPRLLVLIAKIIPENSHGNCPDGRKSSSDIPLETVAAIGFALHHKSHIKD